MYKFRIENGLHVFLLETEILRLVVSFAYYLDMRTQLLLCDLQTEHINFVLCVCAKYIMLIFIYLFCCDINRWALCSLKKNRIKQNHWIVLCILATRSFRLNCDIYSIFWLTRWLGEKLIRISLNRNYNTNATVASLLHFTCTEYEYYMQ